MRLAQLVTGKDNTTLDLGRCSWAVSLLVLIVGAAWNAWNVGAIDLMVLAQAIAIIVTAHGAALWAKRDTEPGAAP